MKVKIDNKKVVYLVTLIFTKENEKMKIEINQSLQKNSKDDYEALLASKLDLQKIHKNITFINQSIMSLTTKIFEDDKPKLTKIK